MKKKVKKIQLGKETLRHLQGASDPPTPDVIDTLADCSIMSCAGTCWCPSNNCPTQIYNAPCIWNTDVPTGRVGCPL